MVVVGEWSRGPDCKKKGGVQSSVIRQTLVTAKNAMSREKVQIVCGAG